MSACLKDSPKIGLLTTATVKANFDIVRQLEWTGDIEHKHCSADIGRQRPGPVLNMFDPYVIAFVRSVVASHLAYLSPHLRDHYEVIAMDFRAAGVRDFIVKLPTLNANNSQALLTAAVLICITTLAQRPQAEEYLLFNIKGLPAWFQLLKGIKAVLISTGTSQIFSGSLETLACTEMHINKPGASMYGYPDLPGWLDHFSRLEDFITQSEVQHRDLFLRALRSLEPFFEAVWGGRDRTYHGKATNLFVFLWIYQQEDEFIQLLEQKHSIPLIIFAHFAVLLKTMEQLWFVSGWSLHILSGIQSVLDPAQASCITWPFQVVEDPRWNEVIQFTRGGFTGKAKELW